MIFKSGINASLPPPINWDTKPKPNSPSIINHSLHHVQLEESESGTPGSQLMPVFINSDYIDHLQEALRCLSESPHRLGQPKLELQEETIIDDVGNIEKLLIIRQPTSPHSQEDAHDSINVSVSSEDQGLTSTFSRLSMSTLPASPSYRQVTRIDSDPVTPGSTLRTASGMSPQTSTGKKRYYAILVGKCAGIYYDEWQVFFFFFFLFLPHSVFAYTGTSFFQGEC